jgi:hypothetical protein
MLADAGLALIAMVKPNKHVGSKLQRAICFIMISPHSESVADRITAPHAPTGMDMSLTVGAGFTFLPPRIMHDVVFGQRQSEHADVVGTTNTALIVGTQARP